MFATRNERQFLGKDAAAATHAKPRPTFKKPKRKNVTLPITNTSKKKASKGSTDLLPLNELVQILNETLSELTPQMVQEIRSKIEQPKSHANSKQKVPKAPSNKILKARQRFKLRQQYRRELNEAIITENPNDGRYITIEVNGHPIQGLVDRGNTVTCLGIGCLDFVKTTKMVMHPYKFDIKTADGRLNAIIGRAKGTVKLNNITRLVEFCLVPTLKLNLSIGLNFINAFNLSQLDPSNLSASIRDVQCKDDGLPDNNCQAKKLKCSEVDT